MSTLIYQSPNLAEYNVESHWFRQKAATRSLLFVYAHPDDESFGNAGTIARYSAAGVAVHYVCATYGELGTVSPTLLNGYGTVDELRRAELLCAAQVLGLASVHFLGYRDSGMRGALDNQHPNAFMNAPLDRTVCQLVAVMRVVRPQVVVTFNAYGGYGHPDHIMAHQVTCRAFQAVSGLSDEFGSVPWEPQKLYYSTFGTQFLKLGIAGLRLMRKDPRRIGTNADVDIVEAATQAGSITTSIDTKTYLDQKQQAWLCHRSQLGGEMALLLKLPRLVRRQFIGTEHFTQVVPSWNGGEHREVDLFAGIPR